MQSIMLRNLRSLKDSKFLEIKPITILVGENNSGKSSFLRVLPLYRQSIEASTSGPILWYGQYVDFGSFADALYNEAEEKAITFGFKLILPRRYLYLRSRVYTDRDFYYGRWFFRESKLLISLEIKIVGGTRGDETSPSEITLEFSGQKVVLSINKDGEVVDLRVNNTSFTNLAELIRVVHRTGFIPDILPIRHEIEPSRTRVHRGPDPFLEKIFDEVRKYVHKNTGDDTIFRIIRNFEIGTSKRMLNSVKGTGHIAKSWEKSIANWTSKSQEFQYLRDLYIAFRTSYLLSAGNVYLVDVMSRVYYIAPVRATAERYYRQQNLSVREVDYQGQNLAMFLRNLTDTERRRFTKWTEDVFGFSAFTRLSGGHVSLRLKEVDSEYEINLADKGFGFSQVLPILSQLWVLSSSRARLIVARSRELPIVFAIEQPELHLHPRLQARLADTFNAAVSFARDLGIDLRLVIETHSETIINRLGHRVANKDISAEDINVIVFEKKKSDSPTTISVGKYNEDGFLTGWPFGFFEPEPIN